MATFLVDVLAKKTGGSKSARASAGLKGGTYASSKEAGKVTEALLICLTPPVGAKRVSTGRLGLFTQSLDAKTT